MNSSSGPDRASKAQEARARILVVEDEVLIRIIISDALRDAGYDVIEAFNGDEAVDMLNAATVFDLILSDVRMPGAVDGLELLRLVREDFPTLPVILTSGHLDPGVAAREGATQFLPKPYLIDRALDLITTALGKLK